MRELVPTRSQGCPRSLLAAWVVAFIVCRRRCPRRLVRVRRVVEFRVFPRRIPRVLAPTRDAEPLFLPCRLVALLPSCRGALGGGTEAVLPAMHPNDLAAPRVAGAVGGRDQLLLLGAEREEVGRGQGRGRGGWLGRGGSAGVVRLPLGVGRLSVLGRQLRERVGAVG